MSRRRRSRPASTDGATRLRVRRPADLLAVIPYLIGFHPSESVVAVLFRDGRVLLTARIDLPPPPLAGELARQLDEVALTHRAEEVVLVVYAAAAEVGRAVLEQVLREPPAPVRDALLVSDARWWSLTCARSCCPPEGTPYDPSAHPLAAQAVYAGLNAQPDRRALERSVAGPDQDAIGPLVEHLVAAEAATASLDPPDAARLMAETVRRCRDEPTQPDQATALLLAVLGRDLAVRDVAWASMDREDAAEHLRIWSRVVACAPPAVASAPLGLLGAAAWISGNGALQNCCVERLERTDPGYTLGRLLADISERALPPWTWDELAEEMRREVSAVAGYEVLH